MPSDTPLNGMSATVCGLPSKKREVTAAKKRKGDTMTKSPISTISYNTVEFLKEKLEGYIDAHIIQGYMFIKHKGEDGDKDHIHVLVIPNKKVDPMYMRADLKEFVKDEEKPRGCMMWYLTHEKNIYDWVLYVVHDKEYLEKKYQDYEQHEKLPYSWKEIEIDC